MVKRISRRFVSLLLTFVTILTLLPAMTLPALAATSGTVTGLVDDNIGLSFSGDADNAWSASGTQIVGSATGTGGTCGDTHYSSTLTITNKKTTTATLSFDYTIVQSSGTIQVDGTAVTANGKFSKELTPNASIKVYIKSGSTSAATKITMTNVTLVYNVTATVTFQPAKNGSYTVDGKTITEAYANTQSSMTAYQVAATPAKGYQFLGWYNVTEKKYINTSPTAALNIESDCTITARFASATAALFETGGQRFDDLNDAITEAQKNLPATIALVTDGPLAGTYTIPSGVTLLIPFDEAKTCYTATPNPTTSQAGAKVFRTLTMTAGSSITLENGAAISVGGQYFAASGGSKGKMVGGYGCINMQSGSAITVQSGGALYAWGFISGSGAVTVQSGGSVYEWYQILDFRGGTASSKIGHKVFPFNQYAVQNIEVPLTVRAGATETAYSGVNALGGIKPTSIVFIGDKGLFKVVSGSLTKAYDGSTDRIHYMIDGVAELNTLSLKLAGVNVDSSNYVLPLTNNMTVELSSGSKLTLNQTVALQPGVELTIGRGAELVVPKNQSMYIYDVDEWGNYCGHGNSSSTFMPVVYAPGRTGKRAPLADVKIDVNGKLTANGGIYTTASGADVCSGEGTGKYFQQGAPGRETTTYQYDGGPTKHDIPITPAKLHNADGKYIETKDAKAGETFTYCTCPDCKGKWTNGLQVAAIIDGNGTQTGTYATLQAAVSSYTPDGKNYIKLLHNTAETITASSDLYVDLNGWTVTGDFNMAGHTLYGMDSSVEGYDALPTGKIVGAVSGYAKTYQTPTVTTAEGETYDRYVAVLGMDADNKTPTLSFHRFNISVSGYRFELATGDTPQCALFFIGKFQGNNDAKAYLTSLGFTLKDTIGGTEQNYICAMTGKDIPDMPVEGEESTSEVIRDGDGAYLFEAYLMRAIDKMIPATYQTQFDATAQAAFKNGGYPSEQRMLSFQEAWQNPGEIKPEQQAILDEFLKDLGITNQTE